MPSGVYPAKVVANNDPQSRGRVTLQIPILFPGGGVTTWAEPIPGPPSSAPTTGSTVWAIFKADDIEQPCYFAS